MKYSVCCHILFVLIFFTACRGKQPGIINYKVEHSDYIEKIITGGTVKAVQTNVIKAPPLGIITIIYLAKDGDMVRKGDTVCIFESAEMILRLENMQSELEQLKANKDRLEADYALKRSLLEAKIENNDIQVKLNSLDSVQQKFAPPLQRKLIGLKRQQADIEHRKLEKKYTSQKVISETELRSLSFRIKNKESQIQRQQSKIDMLAVLSPTDGLVMRTEAPTFHFLTSTGSGNIGGKITEGSTIFEGMPLLELPDMTSMQISVDLPENEYKRVESGQKVTIEIDAADHLQTSGTVNRKLLSGTKASRDSKVKFYEVIIDIDSCHSRMTPGMSASCDIIVSEVKDTLVIPSVALFEEKDVRFVYLSDGEKYHKRYIQTSKMNSSSGVISEGLREGDIIALSEPPPDMLSDAETIDKEPEMSVSPDSTAWQVQADSISVSDSFNSL